MLDHIIKYLENWHKYFLVEAENMKFYFTCLKQDFFRWPNENYFSLLFWDISY